MTEETALDLFRRWVDGFPKKQDAAAHLHISSPYLTDLYKGSRPLTDKILEAIGLERQVSIRRKSA